MKELSNVYFSNLNAVWNSGGYFSAKPDTKWFHGIHMFSQNKFYFITKGHCMIQFDNQIIIAKPGDWFYIPADTEHAYQNIGEPFEKYWTHFDLYPGDNLLALLQLPCMIHVEDTQKIQNLFAELDRLQASNDLADSLLVKSILLTLLSEYIRQACSDTISLIETGTTQINEVLRYISSNLDQPLSNEQLAEKFHMHPNHFIRFFKNKTGKTPAHYVRVCRLETAKRLIEDSDLRISDIMEKIGFTDSGNFSKQFKSYYSMSPRAYKQYYIDSKKVPDV